MNPRISIPPKITRIMPLMGSPVDGEALGAVRAVGRILEHSGLTYCDLAAAIPQGAPSHGLGDGRFGPVPAYKPRRRKIYVFTPGQTAHHRRIAIWLRDNERGRLSQKEREFVANVAGWRRELTIAQADWLVDLVARVEEDALPWA